MNKSNLINDRFCEGNIMLHTYSYSIGNGYQLIGTLTEAKAIQRRIIRSDNTVCLYRDGKGFYIRKIYDDGTSKRIY